MEAQPGSGEGAPVQLTVCIEAVPANNESQVYDGRFQWTALGGEDSEVYTSELVSSWPESRWAASTSVTLSKEFVIEAANRPFQIRLETKCEATRIEDGKVDEKGGAKKAAGKPKSTTADQGFVAQTPLYMALQPLYVGDLRVEQRFEVTGFGDVMVRVEVNKPLLSQDLVKQLLPLDFLVDSVENIPPSGDQLALAELQYSFYGMSVHTMLVDRQKELLDDALSHICPVRNHQLIFLGLIDLADFAALVSQKAMPIVCIPNTMSKLPEGQAVAFVDPSVKKGGKAPAKEAKRMTKSKTSDKLPSVADQYANAWRLSAHPAVVAVSHGEAPLRLNDLFKGALRVALRSEFNSVHPARPDESVEELRDERVSERSTSRTAESKERSDVQETKDNKIQPPAKTVNAKAGSSSPTPPIDQKASAIDAFKRSAARSPKTVRCNPFEFNGGTAINIELRLATRLPALLDSQCAHRFGRAVYVLRYDDTLAFSKLLSHIRESNAMALGMMDQPRRALLNVKLSEEQLSDSSKEDVLSGFQVTDGESRLIVVEGLAEGAALPMLTKLMQRAEPNDEHGSYLHNPQVRFPHRAYAGAFDVTLKQIRLSDTFNSIATSIRMNLKKAIPEECYRAFQRLFQLRKCDSLRSAAMLDCFPTAAELLSLDQKYSAFVSDEDQEGVGVLDADTKLLHTLQSQQIELWPSRAPLPVNLCATPVSVMQ